MSDEATAMIVERLLEGLQVKDAYWHAAHSLAPTSGVQFAAGIGSLSAAASLGVERNTSRGVAMNPSHNSDHEAMFVVMSGGGVNGIPAASCVERQLRGKQRTRKTIEDAIAQCRR